MDGIQLKLNSLLESCEACGPASQIHIDAAQAELGLLFPPSYRYFLEKYGAVLGAGFEIAGLPPDADDNTPMWSDMLSTTLMYRHYDALPEDSVYIASDGGDLSYFLRCSRVNQAFEGEVIVWGPEFGGGITYAESFVSFLERQCGRAV